MSFFYILFILHKIVTTWDDTSQQWVPQALDENLLLHFRRQLSQANNQGTLAGGHGKSMKPLDLQRLVRLKSRMELLEEETGEVGQKIHTLCLFAPYFMFVVSLHREAHLLFQFTKLEASS